MASSRKLQKRTELHDAASEADVARMRELLDAGADATASDDNGWTPLHFAAQASSAEAIELLVAAGAPIDVTDAYGNTPLFRAVFSSQGKGEAINALRKAGADPRRANTSGVSPLNLALTIANYDIKQFFADLEE